MILVDNGRIPTGNVLKLLENPTDISNNDTTKRIKNIYYLERILTSGKANTHSLSLSFEYLEKKSFNFNFEGALVKIQQNDALACPKRARLACVIVFTERSMLKYL